MGEEFGSGAGKQLYHGDAARLTKDSDYAEWGAIGPAEGWSVLPFG